METKYNPKEITHEDALAWANSRRRSDETAMISTCPCCSSMIAIYVQQSARQEIVPNTTPAKLSDPFSILGTARSF